jgi:MoaA/NifB/PqqE/SkfB family radical SAM enzyme
MAQTLFEQRIRRYREIQDAFVHRGFLAFPVVVEVEPTTACDLACAFCPRESLSRPRGRLSEEDLRSILVNLGTPPHRAMLLFSGFGEPTQHEGLADLVRCAKRAGWFCGITSNGTGLSESLAERLLSAGLDVLQVSLHAASDETYGRIVKRASFADVVHRVESVLPVLGNRILLAMNFTVTPWNRKEIRDFSSFWGERGVSHINFSQCHSRGGHFQGLPGTSNGGAPTGTGGDCWTQRNVLYVTWDGRLLACCNDLSGETCRGDLRRTPLREILEGEKGREALYDMCALCDFPFR